MKEEKKLTKRQEDVLTFVKKYIAAHGYPPAIREICAGVGLSSPATVFVHIKNLENMGILRQNNNKFRTIELLVDNEYEDKKETNRICNDCSHDDGHSNDCTRWSVAAEFKRLVVAGG